MLMTCQRIFITAGKIILEREKYLGKSYFLIFDLVVNFVGKYSMLWLNFFDCDP